VKSVVVGSGIGGTYFAYRRSETLGEKVAVLEATNNICGRIVDYEVVGSTKKNPKRVPGCAARWNQNTMFNLRCLANELNLTAYCQPFFSRFYIRGVESTSSAGLFAIKPDLFGDFYNKSVTNDPQTAALNYVLFNGPNPITGLPADGNIRDRCKNYASIMQFYTGELNAEYAQFMAALNSGFTGDYLGSGRTACGYLYKSENDFLLANMYCYPYGGMSMYCRKMREKAIKRGTKFHSNDPVVSINYNKKSKKFTLGTKKGKTFISEEVALNIPPVAIEGKLFGRMTGNVIKKLKNDPHLQSIVNTTTITITGQWSEPWWRPLLDSNGSYTLRRFEDTRGLNRAEIFDTPNFRDIMGLRLVYTDNFYVSQWSSIKGSPNGTKILKEELLRNFRSDPLWRNLTIPDPIKLVYHQQSTAWHFLNSGAPTRDQVVAWAKAPLGKNIKLAMMGEAYDVRYNGWSEGSLQFALSALQRFDKQRFTNARVAKYSSCVNEQNAELIPSVLANENYPPYPYTGARDGSTASFGVSSNTHAPGSFGRSYLEVGFGKLTKETINSIYL
jgi:hypothetical protein